MIVLVESTQAGLQPRRVRVRDRLVARGRAARLDQDLAAGASPEASVPLAVHAQTVTSPASRARLADSVELVAAQAGGWSRPRLPQVSVSTERAGPALPELRAISGRLRARTLVAARGVAMVRVLLSDGNGPLYQEGGGDELEARLREARGALDPL